MNSGGSSPMRAFSGSRSDIEYAGATNYDPNFTAEISNKMQVPKKIRVVTGDGENEEMNGNWNRYGSMDKFSMQVPDRIIVAGREQHVGTKALPRELQLDAVVMPPDPEMIRIQTPPRQITLDSKSSRTVSECTSTDGDEETLVVENNRARFASSRIHNGGLIGLGGGDTSLVIRNTRGETAFGSPGYADPGDEMIAEIEHLREQLSRMNRRILAVEEDSVERKERERYFVIAGILYVAYQTVTWLFRSGQTR